MRLVAVIVATFAAALSAQLPARIDFQRDVQPIFREHCIRCHGPDQQLSGLGLDRRGDAMRGGSQCDIGPGHSEGSRLYHRLIEAYFESGFPYGVNQWISAAATGWATAALAPAR
jgi:hypothetical protein